MAPDADQRSERPDGEPAVSNSPSGESPSGESPSGESPSGESPSGESPSGESGLIDAKRVEPEDMQPQTGERLPERSTYSTSPAIPRMWPGDPRTTGPGDPQLLQVDPDEGPGEPAAKIEQRETRKSEPSAQAVPEGAARAAGEASGQDAAAFKMVTVFYGTDRKKIAAEPTDVARRQRLTLALCTAAATLLCGGLGVAGVKRVFTIPLAALFVAATIGLGIYWAGGELEQMRRLVETDVRYGNERGVMQLGTCRVSIPSTHVRGELESPSIIRLEVREDASRHVVLQAIEPASDEDFYEALRARVAAASRSEVFVFVHGYNVTFEDAARRTAQIAHDVQFAGAPIFFSWPSQGGLLRYTVDETNVAWAVPHLKQFLLDVVQHSGADSVNLIAHSMGNRAMTEALCDLQAQFREGPALFHQVVLAAPDIDAEIFERDLAPALVKSAQRVTLYASSNDQALIASKKFHGYARAGDSGDGLVVIPGIETVDVSALDTSLLGHSYYGSSNPVLSDIRQLIHDSLPAAQRPWLLPKMRGELTYWVFEKIRDTASRTVPPTR